MFGGGGEDEFAGGDEALLVGETDGLAGADGGVGSFEPATPTMPETTKSTSGRVATWTEPAEP